MNGIAPNYEINFSARARQVGIKLCQASGARQYFQKYNFDATAYEGALWQSLSRRSADLLDIAKSVYLGDRLALRCPRGWFDPKKRHWKRVLNLIIPVRDLSFWKNPTVLEQLTTVLDYATEDRWNFTFEPLHNEFHQTSLALKSGACNGQNVSVALFSGGLDAFAGIFAHLNKNRPDKTYLISAVTNRRMRGVQRRLVNALKRELQLSLDHIPVSLHFKERLLPDHLEEKTQRSRGFLYNVTGGVFAHLAGKDKLHLFENGVGALNLPMTDFQIGTDNTRASSPLALLDISKLLSLVFDKSFMIENLALWSTKAELCQALSDSSLRNSIKDTVSCDGSFSRRVRRKRQCGICTSCLLRRQSLAAAGLAEYDPVDDYQFDIFKASEFQNSDRLFAFRAMQVQTQKIKDCLQVSNAWSALGSAFPILEEVKLRQGNLSKPKMEVVQRQILRLYSVYLHEWSIFENRMN